VASVPMMVDSTTELNAAGLNKFLAGDGTTGGGGGTGMACWGVKIRYTGAAWECQADFGAESQIANVGLTWSGANNWLEIDLSSCTNTFENLFLVLTTQSAAAAVPYTINAYSVNTTTARVVFYDSADALYADRIGTEATSMDFNCLFFGQIG